MLRRPETASAAAIEEALALLDAVVAGELLVAAPAHPGDRERHLAAVRLIELAHRRLARAIEAVSDDGCQLREATTVRPCGEATVTQ